MTDESEKEGGRARIAVVAALGALLVLLGGALLLRGTREKEQVAPPAPASAKAAATPAHISPARPTPGAAAEESEASALPAPPSATGEERILLAERTVASAEVDHARTLDALAEAEAALVESEREIEALEQYIADLEARGEDPAKHAFDAMERVNPVIDQFEPRARAVQEAEASEAAARQLLDAARSELEEARRQAP